MTISDEPDAASIERLERAWVSLVRQADRPAVDEHLRRASGVELSRPAYVALARLHDVGAMQISELAAASSVDISTMSRTLKHLLEQGLLERQPGSDRRSALIDASPRGRELVARRRATGQHFLATMLKDWSPDDRETMATLMARLACDFATFFDARANTNSTANHAATTEPT